MALFLLGIACASFSSRQERVQIKANELIEAGKLFETKDAKGAFAKLLTGMIGGSLRSDRELLMLSEILEAGSQTSLVDLGIDIISSTNVNMMEHEGFFEKEIQPCLNELFMFASSNGLSSEQLRAVTSGGDELDSAEICRRVKLVKESGQTSHLGKPREVDRFLKLASGPEMDILEIHAEDNEIYPSQAIEFVKNALEKSMPSAKAKVIKTIDLINDAIEAAASIPLEFMDLSETLKGLGSSLVDIYSILKRKNWKECASIDTRLKGIVDALKVSSREAYTPELEELKSSLISRITGQNHRLSTKIGIVPHLIAFVNRSFVLLALGDETRLKFVQSVIDFSNEIVKKSVFSRIGLADLISSRFLDGPIENIESEYVSFAYEFKRRFGSIFPLPADWSSRKAELVRQLIDSFTLFPSLEWAEYQVNSKIAQAPEEELEYLSKLTVSLLSRRKREIMLVSPGQVVKEFFSGESRFIEYLRNHMAEDFPKRFIEMAEKAKRIRNAFGNLEIESSPSTYSLQLGELLPRNLFQFEVRSGIVEGKSNEKIRSLIEKAGNKFLELLESSLKSKMDVNKELSIFFEKIMTHAFLKMWVGPEDANPSWVSYWTNKHAYNELTVLQTNRRLAAKQINKLSDVICSMDFFIAAVKDGVNPAGFQLSSCIEE